MTLIHRVLILGGWFFLVYCVYPEIHAQYMGICPGTYSQQLRWASLWDEGLVGIRVYGFQGLGVWGSGLVVHGLGHIPWFRNPHPRVQRKTP